MRVLVLGGTKFIGRALVEELHRRGHELLIVHRGEHEPDGWLDVQHLHRDRGSLSASDVSSFAPDVVVDTSAMTRSDAELAVNVVHDDVRCVVLSSMDVYQAYGNLLAGRSGEPVPLAEDAPVRSSRYPYRGRYDDMEDYEKLDVEDIYRARGAVVCRLPAVFGPHDEQRREDFILRRVMAGRTRIPFGAGNWLWSRLHVHDAALALAAVVEHRQTEDDILKASLHADRSPVGKGDSLGRRLDRVVGVCPRRDAAWRSVVVGFDRPAHPRRLLEGASPSQLERP